jgi:antitoxin (DNA-binding transcriptional repressor) of toxin-antitoxin stability system
MKTVTIRDLRQHWPETEKSLQMEDEIVITRDGQPVAKLVRISAAVEKRPRWNVAEHARWQQKVSGGRLSRSDAALAKGRADRAFTSGSK